ncbi:hypothetical protein JCM9533A_18740 [Catenuloplanes niger JCM 9533]
MGGRVPGGIGGSTSWSSAAGEDAAGSAGMAEGVGGAGRSGRGAAIGQNDGDSS